MSSRGQGSSRKKACYMLPSHGEEHTVQAPKKAEFGQIEQKDNLQKDNLPTICFNPSEVKMSNNYLMFWRKSNNAVGLMLPIHPLQGHGQKCWAWILLVCLHQNLAGSPTPSGGSSPDFTVLWTQLTWHDNATVPFQGVL